MNVFRNGNGVPLHGTKLTVQFNSFAIYECKKELTIIIALLFVFRTNCQVAKEVCMQIEKKQTGNGIGRRPTWSLKKTEVLQSVNNSVLDKFSISQYQKTPRGS